MSDIVKAGSTGLVFTSGGPGQPGGLQGHGGEYYPVSEAEIRAVLVREGFTQLDLADTAEVVFSKLVKFEGLDTFVRIYTGVLKATGESRDAGRDAIRVTLGRWDPKKINERTKKLGSLRIFKTLEKVRRTRTWESNLRTRLASIAVLDRLSQGTVVEVLVPVEVETRGGVSEEDLLRAGVGGRVEASAKIELQFESVLVNLESIARPTCPVCGRATTHAKRGKLGLFYGCSGYPQCRGLVDAKEWATKCVLDERK